ncbi:hypothetical protein [Kitasatospora purpeofusca]|uniref:Uncharacterized protein n=1 Tax=Kitasatospora purpeofusca TaxID=67352 RepID=A0ABZ1TVK6_9ACTN|nr:hypothetical protein [Kitasatospora purpeofusca]
MSDHASEPATTIGRPPTAAPETAVGVPTAEPSPVLAPASRHIPKATLVALDITPPSSGQALLKHSFAHQLALRPGEVEAAVRAAGHPAGAPLARLLAGYEEGVAEPPGPAPFAGVPVDELVAFGLAVAQLRRAGSGVRDVDAAADRAVVAVQNLVFNTRSSRLSMLNLERLEMAPAGIQRGELIATIPLAPLEETAVTHKEWSVTSREFTSIVTDSLESYSETGVTDNTELSQSTASQQQHSNQFNITGTVSGGIPVINGSASSGFTAQDSSSTSASESRKHASGLTEKASSRAKQEHKVTISTLTVTGTEETTTRTVKNPSQTQAVRIDYFSLLRTWRVRLYRYGLRAAYDIVVPEPSAAIRKDYVELAALRARPRPLRLQPAARRHHRRRPPGGPGARISAEPQALPLPRRSVRRAGAGPARGHQGDLPQRHRAGRWRLALLPDALPDRGRLRHLRRDGGVPPRHARRQPADALRRGGQRLREGLRGSPARRRGAQRPAVQRLQGPHRRAERADLPP